MHAIDGPPLTDEGCVFQKIIIHALRRIMDVKREDGSIRYASFFSPFTFFFSLLHGENRTSSLQRRSTKFPPSARAGKSAGCRETTENDPTGDRLSDIVIIAEAKYQVHR
jgi:hypothetical protein